MSGQTTTLAARPAQTRSITTPSPSISTSSFQSQDGQSKDPTPSIPENAPILPNGASDVHMPKKPGFTNRLSRMFSQPKVPNDKDLRDASGKPTERSGSESEQGGSVKSWVPKAPSRQASVSDKRPQSAADTDRRQSSSNASNARKELPKDLEHHHKRFEVHDDGTHEHLLKSAKRQEKLSDMLRDMIGGKKKDEAHKNGDQQLSLMSTWIDQLKNERDRLASDQKRGPNATANLVQKYGKCHEIVGRGAFGIVRIAHKNKDAKDASKGELLYAVKEFRRRPQESPKKYQKRLTSEFCISSSLRHPNVIHTLDLLQDAKGDYCEVMEFCAGGDLYTLVLAAGKLEVAEADCYFKQLMCGVEYLHEMGVAHRDLKPENLLLTTHGSLKITDFGNGECFRMAWEKEAHMTAGLCGSAPYIAPEEYVDKEFDPRAVDVWATGVIYMAMRTGRHLWRVAKKDEDEFFERYLEGRREFDGYGPIETLHRARCRNVIYSILDPNPTRRITASQVLKSEWGREITICKAGHEGF